MDLKTAREPVASQPAARGANTGENPPEVDAGANAAGGLGGAARDARVSHTPAAAPNLSRTAGTAGAGTAGASPDAYRAPRES